MNEADFNDVIALLATYLFKESNELNLLNLNQVHSIINLLVKWNIPFQLSYIQGTRSFAKAFSLQITISPTMTITKGFQLQEGTLFS
jgi:hypothetical protein